MSDGLDEPDKDADFEKTFHIQGGCCIYSKCLNTTIWATRKLSLFNDRLPAHIIKYEQVNDR